MDASEMIEVELLESEIRRLKLENRQHLEENERLKSTVSDHEKAQSDIEAELESLKSKKKKLEMTFGKILLEESIRIQEVKDKLDQAGRDRARLEADLNLKTEEAEQLFLEVQELEKTNQEDLIELRKAVAERAALIEQKGAWDDRVDKITEDNTVIILTLLATQNDLEEQLDRKAKVLDAFYARVLELVRNTRGIVEDGGNRWSGRGCGENGGDDSEMENVVRVMVWPLEGELKAIEAAAAFGRGQSWAAEIEKNGVRSSEEGAWPEM